MDIAGGIAVARGPRRYAGRWYGCGRLADEIVRRRRGGALAGGSLEPGAELARELLEGAALARAKRGRFFGRRRGERQYIDLPAFPD